MKKMAFIAALFGVLASAAPAKAARVEVQWWHAMSGVLGDRLNELVEKFNASQDKYTVVAVAKGNYDEVTNGVIAAYRARRPPEMVQIAERGYMTMLLSGAIVPVQDLMEQKGSKIDWPDFIKPVASFWSYKGRMSAMPFNSSTPIFWYNKEHFQKAGFDKPADTWQELEKQLYAIKAKGVSECGAVLPGDFYWSLLENYSAINNQPYATLANGFDGLGTEFVYNKTKVVSQVARLKKWLDDGVLQIAGQGFSPEQLFTSGRCSTFVNSTASHGNIVRNAKIDWGATFLPHENDINPPDGASYHNAPLGKDPNAEHPQLAKLVIAGGIKVFGGQPNRTSVRLICISRLETRWWTRLNRSISSRFIPTKQSPVSCRPCNSKSLKPAR